jgi:ubiquinone/menaquinone biosynthesis C-methylase UbiE
VLIARGEVRKDQVVLDVGCGTGTDAILLAKWGFRRVVGIDPDRGAIAIARRRASRMRLNKRVRFLAVRAEELGQHLPPRSVDVVLHTLVVNNLSDEDEDAHFAEIARTMRPRGLLVLTARTWGTAHNVAPGQVPAGDALPRHFDISPGVTTHLAEQGKFTPPYAHVAVWLGRPRAH